MSSLHASTAALLVLLASAAHAHFRLEEPAAIFEQNFIGDPQLHAPCGDGGSAVPTGALTSVRAGDAIDVTIEETITHPGHYRVALSLGDASGLPADPLVTPGEGTLCYLAAIQDPPVFPILADGVLEHTQAFPEEQTFQVTIPEYVRCERCTLQVIQFHAFHAPDPGGCFHHHCAEISVPEPGATPAYLAGACAFAAIARRRSRVEGI